MIVVLEELESCLMKVNNILVLFIVSVVLSSVALWYGIQSDFIGGRVSAFLTEKISEQLEADIKFKSLDIKLYPPGLELLELEFKRDAESEVKIYAKKAGIRFDLIQSMQRELTLEDIYIEDSSIELGYVKKKKKKKDSVKLNEISIKEILVQLKEQVPIKVDNVSAKNVKLKLNEYDLKANEIIISPSGNGLAMNLDIEDINPKIYDFKFERLKTKLIIDDEVLSLESMSISTKEKMLNLSGNIINYKNRKNAQVNIDYEAIGKINYFNEFLKELKVELIKNGDLTIIGQLQGSLGNFKNKSTIKLINAKTPFVNAKTIEANVIINNNEIRVSDFSLENNDERLKLNKSFQFLNLKNMTFVNEPIEVSVSKLKLGNALKIMKENLSVLDGEITGDIEFILNKNDYHFKINQKSELQNLSLIVDDSKILNVPKLFTDQAIFSVYKNQFKMNMKIYNDDSKLEVEGVVDFGKGLKFKTRNAKINLKEIGKITGLNYQGTGLVDIDVFMDKEISYMNIKGSFKNFKLEEYSQKNVKAELNLDFNKRKIVISDIEASAGRTKSNGYIEINLENMEISGQVKHSNIIYEEFLESLDLEDYLSGNTVEGNWSAEYKISGKADPKLIILKGKIKGKNNLIIDESVDSIEANLLIKDQNILISNIYAKKAKGSVKGEFSYSMKSETSNFSFYPSLIAIEELTMVGKLPLGINGKLSGELMGVYKNELTSFSTSLDIVDSIIPDKSIGDSHIELTLNEKIIGIQLNLLGGKINLNSKNYLDDSKESYLNFKTTIDDINEVIGTNRLVDLENTNIKGLLYSEGEANYKIKKFKFQNAKLNVKRFELHKDLINLKYERPDFEEIKILNDIIKKWSFYIRGQNFYFISKATGAFYKTFNLDTDFKVDASIFEVFNKVISKATGPIYGKYKISNLKDLSNQKLKLSADDLSLSTSGYPIRFENIGFKIDADNKKISIESFRSKIGAGMFSLVGDINIEQLIPKLDFEFEFTNAGINLFEKSNVIFSSQGQIKGDSFPYRINSDFYIERFNLVNEFTDLISDKNILKEEIKYLPHSYIDKSQNLLDLDINIKLINPASVKNSMSDLSYLGEINIFGSEINPKARGSFYLSPGINKIFFKGNEYNILKSNISFLENNAISNPELDIEASSVIEDYSLTAKVTGAVDNFDLNLRTEPSLEENDILSLIAFGYTENTSSSLSEEQKNLMTQAGIGSLLFESFKINETLKKELGIQLNLGTEISSLNENYLSQKSATGTSNQSVTSATKIELKKEINSDVDLAVSSTVGSSSQQRQRMNLNYKISDKVSLEGVYENRTNTETSTQGDDSSLGVDVRWKWTFK